MKYYYKKLVDDDDFIVLGNRKQFVEIIRDQRLLDDIRVEDMTKSMYYGLYLFEQERNLVHTDLDILIRQDSPLGEFILSNSDMFIDYDNYISYDKVVGAYLVSAYDEQAKMNNKIFRLLKERKSGTKQELMEEHSEHVLDYILENSNYELHLKKIDGKTKRENKKYIVYEDGYYSIRNFQREKEIQKVKKERAS